MKRVARRARLLVSAIVMSLGLAAYGQAVQANTLLITAEDLRKIAPKARDEFIEAFLEAQPEFEAAGITTRLRMAHFMAQVLTETGGLRRIDENMNYSYRTLLRVFSRKTVSDEVAQRIAGQPRLVANWVYGHRLGNRGRDTDDGWNYRGSGFIQLTGRDNFINRGKEIGVPLADNPELARDPKVGLTAAIAYWSANNINAAADAHDHNRVRKLVNGPAAHGAKQAREFFNQAWRRVFSAKDAQGFETGIEFATDERSTREIFDDILEEGGFVPRGFSANESDAFETRTEALKVYQTVWDLPVTGELDDATREAMLDPAMWRYKDIEAEPVVMTSVRPEDPATPISTDPEASVAFRFDGDVKTETSTGAETGTESGSIGMIEASAGTGQLEPDVTMSQEDLRALNGASAIYADYEMGDRAARPETFKPFSILGADDRVAVINTTTFPARAVVQIRFTNHAGSRSLCSGTMIAPDTVLTAAHCIHSGTVAGRLYSEFRITPARNVGAAPYGACNAVGAFMLNGWTSAANALDAREYDLGAFKLDCRVGDRTGQLAIRVLEDDEVGLKTVVHGYAADKAPTGRQWVSTDEIRVLQSLKGFYHNDTFGGTSGSAVYAVGQEDTIIGVHTNGLHGEEPWASHNAFTRITEERLAKIRQWVAQ